MTATLLQGKVEAAASLYPWGIHSLSLPQIWKMQMIGNPTKNSSKFPPCANDLLACDCRFPVTVSGLAYSLLTAKMEALTGSEAEGWEECNAKLFELCDRCVLFSNRKATITRGKSFSQ